MKRRLFGRRRREDESEDSVWIAFSDLMTAMLAIFMLAAVALVFSLSREQAALAQAQERADEANARSEKFDAMLRTLSTSEQVRAEMVAEIRELLAEHGIEVEVDAANTVIRVPVDLLGFESGSSEILGQYTPHALTIGETLADVLLKDDRYLHLDTIFVEGHTDDVPMQSLFGGNWGLSANRAISLWRLWEEGLSVDLSGLVGRTGEPLFSVSGYADTRPVVPDQRNAKARAQNRRIDIRFTEHRLSEEEISDLQGAITAGTS